MRPTQGELDHYRELAEQAIAGLERRQRERGTTELWFAMHDHGDDIGGHQHFPANGGHGSHDGIALVPWNPAH